MQASAMAQQDLNAQQLLGSGTNQLNLKAVSLFDLSTACMVHTTGGHARPHMQTAACAIKRGA